MGTSCLPALGQVVLQSPTFSGWLWAAEAETQRVSWCSFLDASQKEAAVR